MSKYSYLGLVIKDIRRKIFSSSLTLIAISLGIMSIFVILMLGSGFQNSIEESFAEFGTNKIFISAEGGFELRDNDLKFIQSRNYIEEAFPLYVDRAEIELGNDKRVSTLYGTELGEDFFESFNLDIEFGRAPRENEKFSMVIGPEFAENFFDKEVRLGSNIFIKDTKFKVVGIFESLGNPQDDGVIYFNIDTLRDLFERDDEIDQVFAEVVNGVDPIIAADNLKIALENKLGDDSVEIQTSDQILDQFGNILLIINATLGFIAVISIIVGAFGIINTMYVIVTEKTKEIGIMKSIGATNPIILSMFMFQAGLYGLLGSILGIIVGTGVVVLAEYLVVEVLRYDLLSIVYDPLIYVGLLFFGFLTGILAGFLPSYTASKINIIEAIRK